MHFAILACFSCLQLTPIKERILDTAMYNRIALIRGVRRKFATRHKNLLLIKNPHFCSDQADIQPISLTHEVIILTKFHNVRVKTVDFLVIAKFWLSSKFSP